jgi:hypothetical protein
VRKRRVFWDDANEDGSRKFQFTRPAVVAPSSPSGLNAQHFLKPGGNFIISIKANCIDSTVPAEAVFAREIKKLQQEQFKPAEQLTLEPYERDHAIVCGSYRVGKKKAKD